MSERKLVPGRIEVMFRSCYITSAEAALKFIFGLGLGVGGPVRQCGQGGLSVTVVVKVGDEVEWVQRLCLCAEVVRAVHCYFSDADEEVVGELIRRLS